MYKYLFYYYYLSCKLFHATPFMCNIIHLGLGFYYHYIVKCYDVLHCGHGETLSHLIMYTCSAVTFRIKHHFFWSLRGAANPANPARAKGIIKKSNLQPTVKFDLLTEIEA